MLALAFIVIRRSVARQSRIEEHNSWSPVLHTIIFAQHFQISVNEKKERQFFAAAGGVEKSLRARIEHRKRRAKSFFCLRRESEVADKFYFRCLSLIEVFCCTGREIFGFICRSVA